MHKRSGVHFAAIFAPILALVVGMAIILKSGGSDEIGSRLRLIDMTVDEVFCIESAWRRILNGGDDLNRADLVRRITALGKLFEDIKVASPEEITTYQKIRRNIDRLDELTGRSQDRGGAARSGGLEVELFQVLRTVVTETVALAAIMHADTLLAQQRADSLIIIFSAIIAVLMAISAYMAARTEITQRQEMARELEQSNLMLSDAFVKLHRAEQGVHQQRLHALESMAQSVGYEIGSNLAPIMRISDTLLNYPEYLNDLERVRGGLLNISKTARIAKDSIERLTHFVGGSKAADISTLVDIKRLVDDSMAAVQSKIAEAFTRDIKYDMKCEFEAANVEGFESELREALVQLINNALDAMPRGGTLIFSSESKGDEIMIAVTDTGKGMTGEVLRHCTEPFFSTKGEMASGMGLTIVSAAVRHHGGRLDIRSKPGAGTTVTLVMPAKSPVTLAEPEKTADLFEIGSLHILVVDDQQWIGQTLNDLLSEDGHRVEFVTSAKDALRLLRDNDFDLLITDRAMPDMNGEQLASAAHELMPKIRIILLTGFGEIIKDMGISSQNVDLVLSKPVTPESLRRGISEAMHKGRPPPTSTSKSGFKVYKGIPVK